MDSHRRNSERLANYLGNEETTRRLRTIDEHLCALALITFLCRLAGGAL